MKIKPLLLILEAVSTYVWYRHASMDDILMAVLSFLLNNDFSM